MYRAGFTGILLGLVVLAAGCRMCAHPYDYCGPTFTGVGVPCPPDEPRAGSILAAGAVPVPPAVDETEEIDYTLGPNAVSILEGTDEGGVEGARFAQRPILGPPEQAQETPGWVPQR